jgi:hypothetical protein
MFEEGTRPLYMRLVHHQVLPFVTICGHGISLGVHVSWRVLQITQLPIQMTLFPLRFVQKF